MLQLLCLRIILSSAPTLPQVPQKRNMPTFAYEVDLDLSAPVLCGALKEQNTLFPTIAPQVIASMEVLEGEVGKPGSVRKITFGPLAPGITFVKEKLISLDVEKFSFTSEEIEGGHIAQGFTKFVQTMAVVPVGEDKSKLTVSADYEGGSEESLSKSKEGMKIFFKALEGHLKSQNT